MTRCLIVVTIAALALTGCNSLPWQNKEKAPVAELPPTEAAPIPPPAAGANSTYEAPIVPPPGLALAPDQRFKDIPLPVGLKEDSERTFVYESASLQVGRMVYTTRASVYDLVQFFNRECPTAGWKMENILEADGKLLMFRKPGKQLEVWVQSVSITQGRRLTITLKPEAGGSGT